MYRPTPKYRKQLNDNQVKVLKLLYKFRFGNSELLAQSLGKQRSMDVYRRLRVLEDQGLIAKRYEPNYKLLGKPAAYYLLPAGARALQEREPETEVNIKSIYKDKTISEQFILHCLDIFAVCNRMQVTHGDGMKFFTKSQLAKYDYFPQKLPDAYIRLTTKDGESQFFLDIHHDSQPFFTALRRVKQYIDYSEQADWTVTNTAFPVILFVCESSNTLKRLRKRIIKLVGDSWDDDIAFALTTIAELLSDKDAVWHRADEDEETFTLNQI